LQNSKLPKICGFAHALCAPRDIAIETLGTAKFINPLEFFMPYSIAVGHALFEGYRPFCIPFD
jgi:hypothetical protein